MHYKHEEQTQADTDNKRFLWTQLSLSYVDTHTDFALREKGKQVERIDHLSFYNSFRQSQFRLSVCSLLLGQSTW